jgi:hypothetical protein
MPRTGSHSTTGASKLVEGHKPYRQRMKEARAEARAKREAEKAAWARSVELMATARMVALDAVKRTIRDRGDRVTHYTHAQPRAQADEMLGPWMILKAKERIAEGKSRHMSKSQRPDAQALLLNVNHSQNGAPK